MRKMSLRSSGAARWKLLMAVALFACLSAAQVQPAAAQVGFGTLTSLNTGTGGGAGPQLAASGNNVYVVWTGAENLSSHIAFRASQDGGTVFGSEIRLVAPLNEGYHDPQIATAGSYVYVVWNATGPSTWLPNSDVHFAVSADGGATFGSPVSLGGPKVGLLASPQIATSGDNVYIVWKDDRQGEFGEIRFASSSNRGATFTGVVNLSNTPSGDSGNPRIAASGNYVYVVWSESIPGNSGIYLRVGVVIPNQGVRFGSPINLMSSSVASDGAQIVVSGREFYVIWLSRLSSTNTDIFFAEGTLSPVDTPISAAPINLSNNSGESSQPQLAISGSNVYALWRDESSGGPEILFKASSNKGVSWGSLTSLSGTTQAPDSPQIAAAGNNAYAVWSDAKPGNEAIRFRVVADGGATLGPIDNLGSLTGAGWFNQPRIVESGTRVYVTWQDRALATPSVKFRRSDILSFILTFETGQNNLVANQGVDANTQIAVEVLSGLVQPVTFSMTGFPSGSAVTFTPVSCTPTGTPPKCATQVGVTTSFGTQPDIYNMLVAGTMGAATASITWTVTVSDNTPPAVAIISAKISADGFLPAATYSGTAVTWSSGQAIPSVTAGSRQVHLTGTATDQVAVNAVTITCSPTCGTIAANLLPSTGPSVTWQASVPLAVAPNLITVEARDRAQNTANTFLGVQVNLDADADGIQNNVDGDCTTTPVTSKSFDPSSTGSHRFCDLPLGGKTSGIVLSKDPGITVGIEDAPRPDGVTVKAVGPSSQKVVLKLDGVGSSKLTTYDVFGGTTVVLTDPELTTIIDVIHGLVEARVGPTAIVVKAGQKVRVTESVVGGKLTKFSCASLRGTITVNGKICRRAKR